MDRSGEYRGRDGYTGTELGGGTMKNVKVVLAVVGVIVLILLVLSVIGWIVSTLRVLVYLAVLALIIVGVWRLAHRRPHAHR